MITLIDVEDQLDVVNMLLMQINEPNTGYTVNAYCERKVVKACYTDFNEAVYLAHHLYQTGSVSKVEIVDPTGHTTHKYERVFQPASTAKV